MYFFLILYLVAAAVSSLCLMFIIFYDCVADESDFKKSLKKECEIFWICAVPIFNIYVLAVAIITTIFILITKNENKV